MPVRPGSLCGRTGKFLCGKSPVTCGILLLVATTLSCVMVPVPAPRKNSGPTALVGSTDTEFIRIGVTTRQEIFEKLGWLKVGKDDDRVFWGRWLTSGSAMAWGVVMGGADVNRLWGGRNILVEFDDNGRVTDFRTFEDPELPKVVADWVKRSGEKLDLSRPVKLAVKHRHAAGSEAYVPAELSLGTDQFEFSEVQSTHCFRLAPSALKTLQMAGFFNSEESSAVSTNITLQFNKNTKAGSHITVDVGMSDLVTLVRYIHQVRPQALPPPPKPRNSVRSQNTSPKGS